VFKLDETIHGPQRLRLVFLPGCRVDLACLRFLKAGE